MRNNARQSFFLATTSTILILLSFVDQILTTGFDEMSIRTKFAFPLSALAMAYVSWLLFKDLQTRAGD